MHQLGSLRRREVCRRSNVSTGRPLTLPSPPGEGLRHATWPDMAVAEGPIAQSEERRTRIAEVVGSNPIRSTSWNGS